jgi:xanthine/uracil permease
MQFLKHVDGMHDVLKDVNVSLTLVILYAAEAIILGFQHFIVMLGTTVIIPSALVPQMGGGNVSPKTYVLNSGYVLFIGF